nr:hypothetical protein CFP56_71458 [Quercus suber]
MVPPTVYWSAEEIEEAPARADRNSLDGYPIPGKVPLASLSDKDHEVRSPAAHKLLYDLGVHGPVLAGQPPRDSRFEFRPHGTKTDRRVPFDKATMQLKRQSLVLYESLLDLQEQFKLKAAAFMPEHPLVDLGIDPDLESDCILPAAVSSLLPPSVVLESLWTNAIDMQEDMPDPTVRQTEYERKADDFEEAKRNFREAHHADVLGKIPQTMIDQKRFTKDMMNIKDLLEKIEPVMEAVIDEYGLLVEILEDLLEVHSLCADLEDLWRSSERSDNCER